MLVSLDIETASLTEDRDDALYPHLSYITIIGAWAPGFSQTWTDLKEFQQYLIDHPDNVYLGHNFQFDLKHLRYHGVEIPLSRWAHDTSLMASACTQKVTPGWLQGYELKRRELNAKLPVGISHREGRARSLKVLAPYFLGVQPFWEDPSNHASVSYVLKDCEYTYRLYTKFQEMMRNDGSTEFYQNFLMPKARMFQRAIHRGFSVDIDRLKRQQEEDAEKASKLGAQLTETWKDAFSAYHKKCEKEINEKYASMEAAAVLKGKDPVKMQKYYEKLRLQALTKIEPLNLDSPTQLAWLLEDHFKYDIHDFAGKKSTGKEVLARLSAQHKDVALFTDYRKTNKLVTAFYPSLLKFADRGVIRCSVNLDGTRTGRTSVSGPNLQQIPPSVKPLFVAREGYSLITLDESSIEPRIIAFLTEDAILCDLMINNGDFHSRNAVVMFGLDCQDSDVKEQFPVERKIAKELGLALLYGAGPKRIQQSAQKYGFVWPIKRCKEIFENFKDLYHEVYKFKKNLDIAAESGAVIENIFGRKHTYPDPDEIHMKTFNTLIQSSASDLLIESADKAEIELGSKGLDCGLLMTVHDEVIFECLDAHLDQASKIIEEKMTGFTLATKYGKIPLSVEGGISKKWEKA